MLSSRRARIATLLALGVAACSGGADSTTAASSSPKSLQVLNYLTLPVTLTAGGVLYGTLDGSGGSAPIQTVLSLPGNASSLSYAVQPRRFSDGAAMPNELGGATVAVGVGTSGTVSITNIVSGQPYFMARIVNQSGASLQVGIAQANQVQCVGTTSLPVFIADVSWWGYYRLASTTQLRLYYPGTQCTGQYLYWDFAALSGFSPNNGVISLQVTTSPGPPPGTPVDHIDVCDQGFLPLICFNYKFASSPGAVISVRATAFASSGADMSSACAFAWSSTVPGVVSVVPSADGTHRDAVITRLVYLTPADVTVSCGGKVGVFSIK